MVPLMATPPASGGQPEESSAPLEPNSGGQPEAPPQAPQAVEQAEDAVSESCGTKRKHSSPVWDYFTREKVNGVWKAKCIWCDMYLSDETEDGLGTANLTAHLDICLGKNRECGKTKTGLWLGSVKQRRVSLESDVSDHKEARKALCSMFTLHEFPLSLADHPGLRTFVGALQPISGMVNQNSISMDILDHYETGKKKVLNYLQKNKCRVAVTAEFWTDNKRRGYMAVTGHFIDDKSWKPKKCILRFVHVPYPHTSYVLCEALYNCLHTWDLDRKISTLTLHNCSADDPLVPLIKAKIGPANLLLGGKMLHLGYCTHSLNSVVDDGLEVIWTEIGRIRDSVAYCLATPNRYEELEEAAQSEQVALTEKLCLDCKTRWNSTYIMLRVALRYKKVFDRLNQIDSHFTSCPTAEDWEFASSVCDKLLLFQDLSDMFSGTKYVTANTFFIHICEIKMKMHKWLGCGDPRIEKMAAAMMEKFDKYWSDIHGLLALAIILDPRGKMTMLHVCYEILFGEENSEHHVRKSRDLLCELINEYKVQKEEEVATSSCDPSSLTGMEKVLAEYKAFVAKRRARDAIKPEDELDHYLEQENYPYTDEFDILDWWEYRRRYPTLRMIARDILAIPITRIASESTTSTGGRVLSGHCSRLRPKVLEALICSQDWHRNDVQGEEGMRDSGMRGRR
ncbi:hypothetical protein ACP70R_021206 [Stipagrostis hirtigluma subsp. patula]